MSLKFKVQRMDLSMRYIRRIFEEISQYVWNDAEID